MFFERTLWLRIPGKTHMRNRKIQRLNRILHFSLWTICHDPCSDPAVHFFCVCVAQTGSRQLDRHYGAQLYQKRQKQINEKRPTTPASNILKSPCQCLSQECATKDCICNLGYRAQFLQGRSSVNAKQIFIDPPAPVGAKGMCFPSRLDLVALLAQGIKARTKTCFEEAAAVRDADPAIWTRIFQQPLQTIT